MKNIFSLLLVFLIPFILFSQDYEEIKASELPKGVKQYLNKYMPGSEISRAAKGIEHGNTIYATVIQDKSNKRILIFDEEGRFLRKAENLSSPSTDPPPISNTANPKSESAPASKPNAVAMQTIPEKSLPESIRTFLRENHTNYTLLEITYVPFAEAPLFKILLRDAQSDNLYLFNARGEKTSKRSYELVNSPFTKQYPLKK